MAVELVDRMAILLAIRRFHGMGGPDSRPDTYVLMQHFVRRATYVPFRCFLGMCGEKSCNVLMMLFMVLWVPIFATLCRRAVLMLWHAFLFVGLRFFPPFYFCCVISTAFFVYVIYFVESSFVASFLFIIIYIFFCGRLKIIISSVATMYFFTSSPPSGIRRHRMRMRG
jgi:hypothetical protein